ncbi:MAG TPA: hypothetical protein PLC98_03625 [Anaerolineales bacterium]|nr:hypothetical protein [Anaerolineales bacterium]
MTEAFYLTKYGLPDPAEVDNDVFTAAVWESWMVDVAGRIGGLRAASAAERLRSWLAPACELAVVAGSLRRGKPRVKDIDLVVKPCPDGDLFSSDPNRPRLADLLADAIAAGWLRQAGANGERLKRLEIRSEVHYPGAATSAPNYKTDVAWIKAELHIVRPPAQFGLVQLLRTGPAEYSQWIVTSKAQGGALPGHVMIDQAALWQRTDRGTPAVVIPTETEADVCAALGIDLVDPELRAPQWKR